MRFGCKQAYETRKFHKYPESCRGKGNFRDFDCAYYTIRERARLYDSISCPKCAKNTHLACGHKRNLSKIAFQFVINCANGRTLSRLSPVGNLHHTQPPCLPWVPIERHTCTHSNMCMRTHSCRRRRSRVAYNNYNIYSNRMPYWRLSRLCCCCCSHNTHQQSGAVLKCAGILNSNKH